MANPEAIEFDWIRQAIFLSCFGLHPSLENAVLIDVDRLI